MASRSGTRAITAKVKGVAELDAFLRDQIAREDLNPAKRDLRQGTKRIAEAVLIPALKASAQGTGREMASRMADTARARTDRYVTVRIGAVNPKLSGFKKGVGIQKAERQGRKRHSQSYRTTLAWGSDKGPWPGNPINNYGIQRSDRGTWVLPTVTETQTWNDVKDAYQKLLGQILADYGRYR